MSNTTAGLLIDKLRRSPEILEAIRQLLNAEAGHKNPSINRLQPMSTMTRTSDRDIGLAQKVWAGASRRDVALEYGISMGRVNQIMAMYPNPNPAQPRTAPNAERDLAIATKVHAGQPRGEVAHEYGLSLQRVHQIMYTHPDPNHDPSAPKVNPNAQRDAELAAKVHAGYPRAELATEYGLSLQRVHQIMRMHPNPNPTAPKTKPNATRDAEIIKQVAAKVPRTEIAIKHGISLERVHQIARGTAGKKKKLTFEERVAVSHAKYASFEPLTFGDEVNILVTKYEIVARQIAQDHLNGLSQAQLEAKYPSDMTSGDIAWWGAHYAAAYRHFIDHETGQWVR